MDNGIEQGFLPAMNNQQFRLQLYQDWIACYNDGDTAEEFRANKGISAKDHESIVREFKSLDPNGGKWGKLGNP